MPNYGRLLTEEERDKIVKLRLEGKSWSQVTKEMGKHKSTGITWAKTKWFKARLASAQAKAGLDQHVSKDEPVKEPKVDEEPGDVKPKEPTKDEPAKPTPVAQAKKVAQGVVDQTVTKHIKSSDKAPRKTVKKDAGQGKLEGVADDKSTSPVNFGITVWLILIIVIVACVFGLVMLFKSKETIKDVGQEAEKEDVGTGFEGRSIEEL